MSEILPISAEILSRFPAVDEKKVDELLEKKLAALNRKIVVLDDDPTGVQTVHDIYVYTDWSEETMLKAFNDEHSMFFILTNSRGMTREETECQHRIMAENIAKASSASGKDYILISRSDSTLRGHYPLETKTLRKTLESISDKRFDGEIIYPFFKEGGRYTIGDIHYVKEQDVLTPAGMTEFAKDKSFGYKSSYMPAWCQEKSEGEYRMEDVVCISLDDLRALEVDKIAAQLKAVKGFNKLIVNSIDYVDVKVFALALLDAIEAGKEFMFRSAAAVTKVLGGVSDKPLLSRAELVDEGNSRGGVIIVGSHVNKTTKQLEQLKSCKYPLEFIQFDQHRVLEEGGLEKEVERVIALTEEYICAGKTVAVYTRRDRFDLDTDDKDKQLEVSVRISDAVTSIVGKLKEKPAFIIAKGGITSSDIGTKALRVKRATVMGQVRPGIPVWLTGEESKFPNMPYIIFPGNVGSEDDLRVIVETLMEGCEK